MLKLQSPSAHVYDRNDFDFLGCCAMGVQLHSPCKAACCCTNHVCMTLDALSDKDVCHAPSCCTARCSKMACTHSFRACAGKLEIPQEALYKKNVLITRGRFRPFTLLHNDMLVGAASQFFCDPDGSLRSQDPDMTFDTYTDCVYRDDTLVLLELTTRDMMEVSSCRSF